MSQQAPFWVHDAWDEPKGRSIAIEVTRTLESFATGYQQLDLYETRAFGRMLVLDGVVMLTEADELAYHEMIAHVPLSTHPDPRRVLVVGGGDGGTAREVLRHPEVERVTVCEIDGEVIRVSREYLPALASSFDDPRVEIREADGARFVAEHPDTFDVIIVDSSDPWGPAEVLFQEPFYRSMRDALKTDGIAVTQSESMFYDTDTIRELQGFTQELFPVARYYYTLVPTYPSGTIGFSFCSKGPDPLTDFRDKGLAGLRYYNPEIHRAAFALPTFLR